MPWAPMRRMMSFGDGSEACLDGNSNTITDEMSLSVFTGPDTNLLLGSSWGAGLAGDKVKL